MATYEHVLDLIPAYVLDCLDDEETIRVRQHLANCQLCQDEARAYETVAAQLPSAISQVSPPDRLRARLLQSVDQSIPKQTARAQPVSHSAFWQWLQRWRIAPLVGVGLILILALSNVLLWQQINLLRAEIPNTAMIVQPLYPSGVDANATGIVVMDPRGAYGTIIADSLPPSIAGHQYQVWLSWNDKIESGGVLTIHESGYGAQVIYTSLPLNVYNHIWVTVEPQGGSERPTGVTVLQTVP
jgi:anti-sigma-K factor RskA